MKQYLLPTIFFSIALLYGTEIKQTGTFSAQGIPGKTEIPALLDGKTLLVHPCKHTGAQTIRVRVRYPGAPSGALISRFRPENGMRGYEAGFAAKNPYNPIGHKPSLLLSAGSRDSNFVFLDSTSLTPPPGTELEYILRYRPGRELRFDLFRADDGTFLRSGKADASAVAALAPRAGEGLLVIGGRRINSRRCGFFAPEGTGILALSIFDRALDNAELASRYRLRFPEPPAKPVIRYVNARTGNDANDGLSPEHPLATIRKAADSVNPGDTVLIRPGIYYENVVLSRGGTADAPVTFRADNRNGEHVILTAADRNLREKKIRWKLEDAKHQIYSIPFPHHPARMLCDGRIDLFGGYFDLEGLRAFTLKDGYPGPLNGYTWDEKTKRLLVRLPADGRYGSPNPEDHFFCAAPPASEGVNGHHMTGPETACIFIRLRGKAHIILDGFTLETPAMAGIGNLGEEVVVRNCRFKGCRFGVFGGSRVFVENCTYDQYPVFQETNRIIERHHGSETAKKFRFYFWSYKGVNTDYSRRPFKNYETGIIGGVRSDWHLRDCIIEDSFEGFSSWCVSNARNLRVYGNIFRRIVDNAVETENHAADVRIYGNLFEDNAEAISWQPLAGTPWPGPVFVYRNLFTETPALSQIRKAFGNHPGVFKLGASGQNWTGAHMGGTTVDVLESRISKRFAAVPDPGFLAFNNTILQPGHNLLTTPQPISGPAKRELVNFRFFNNLNITHGLHNRPEWRGSLIEFFRNWNLTRPDDPQKDLVSAGNGMNLNSIGEFGFRNPEKGDYRLAESSPLIGKGSLMLEEQDASADIGALPCGSGFELSAGPNSGIDEQKWSPFQRKVRYNPDLIFTTDKYNGIRGVYRQEKPIPIALPVRTPFSGKLELVVRITERAGEYPVLQAGKFLVAFRISRGTGELVFRRSGKTETRPIGRTEHGKQALLELEFGETNIIPVFLGTRLAPVGLLPEQGKEFEVLAGKLPLYDVRAR